MQNQAPVGLGLPVQIHTARGGIGAGTGPPLLGEVRMVQSIAAHEGVIWVMEVSKNGAHIATGGQDGMVKVWKLQPGAGSKAGNRPFDRGLLGAVAGASSFSQPTARPPIISKFLYESDEGMGPGSTQDPAANSDSVQGSGASNLPAFLFAGDDGSGPDGAYVGPGPVIRPKPLAVFSGHTEDVLDLSWSPGGFLLSASVSHALPACPPVMCCQQNTLLSNRALL